MSDNPEKLDMPAGALEQLKLAYLRQASGDNPPSRESLLRDVPEDQRNELLQFFQELDDLDDLVLPNDGSAEEERIAILAAAFCPKTSSAARIGIYDIGAPVGVPGGMGEVRETRLPDGTRAALKLCRGAPTVMRQIRQQVEAVMKLEHRNIVRIYDLGRDEASGSLFYVMEFMDCGDLGEHIGNGRFRTEVVEAARVLAEAARGVAEAHRHLIAHSDLKPRNILMGTDGSVKIADFDLARKLVPTRLGDNVVEATSVSGHIRGTLRYYSPEQARGKRLTKASEVYTLGAILFEMLTGQPLVRSETPLKIFAEIAEKPPQMIRELNPAVPSDLERICLACLEKDPARRFYQSADDLAADLDNWRQGRPISIPPVTRTKRIFWWINRNRVTAILLLCLSLLPPMAAGFLVKSDIDHEAMLRSELGRTNTYVARQVAGTILFQLGQYSSAVVETAQNEDFHTAWNKQDRANLENVLKTAIERYNSDPRMGLAQRRIAPTFASLFVLNRKGELIAIWPKEPASKHFTFAGRDYFCGAMRHAEMDTRAAVHISRMFESEIDKLHKFSISVPFYARANRKGAPDGVLAATLTTDSTLGLGQLHDDNSKVALVLPLDSNPPDRELPKDGSVTRCKILLHPAYAFTGTDPVDFPLKDGQPTPKQAPGPELRIPPTEQEFEPDDNYEDPVAGDPKKKAKDYAGRWVAGFSQVGNTEMIVVVQQRYANAIDRPKQWLWRFIVLVGGALLVAAALTVAIAMRLYRLAKPIR